MLGIIAFLATVIQIMLMLVRGGMLVLLVGTLPLVAAFSNTEMGMQWFRKASAWLLAFALYKPAAAVVYAVAFDLAGQQGALALLDGVMMLVLAILALPALLRFVVPATSALAGAGGCGRDARRRGGRGDRDADADRRRTARRDARQRLRASADGGGPSGAALAGGRRPGGHERQRPVRLAGAGRPRREPKRRSCGRTRGGRVSRPGGRLCGRRGSSRRRGRRRERGGQWRRQLRRAVVQAYGAGKQAAQGAVDSSNSGEGGEGPARRGREAQLKRRGSDGGRDSADRAYVWELAAAAAARSLASRADLERAVDRRV